MFTIFIGFSYAIKIVTYLLFKGLTSKTCLIGEDHLLTEGIMKEVPEDLMKGGIDTKGTIGIDTGNTD